MGLNCKVKRSYMYWVLDEIKKDQHIKYKCSFKVDGKLCNPEAGSFAEECTKCNRFQ